MNEEFGDVKKLAAEKFPGQFSSNEEMLFTLTMDGLTVHMFGLPGDPFTVCVRTRVLSMDTVPRAADFARAAIAGNFFWGGTRGATLSVAADEDGARYFIVGPDGEEVDASDGWDALVARLDAALPDGDEVQIIWP